MATGGELTPGSASHVPQFAADELRAAVDEASRHNLPTTAHAHGTVGIANTVTAGVDMIEHGSFMTADSVQADPAIIKAIAEAGIPIGVTNVQKPIPGAAPPARIAAALPLIVAVFRDLRAAEIPLVCSSDGGIAPVNSFDALPYGPATMAERLGYTPVGALRTVTSLAAQVCRLGGRKGRLAPGYDADLLAVAGDVLTDLTAVSAVFRAGARFDDMTTRAEPAATPLNIPFSRRGTRLTEGPSPGMGMPTPPPRMCPDSFVGASMSISGG